MSDVRVQALIDTIHNALLADARIESAWLSGSLARGTADEWSDVDTVVVPSEAQFDAALRAYTDNLSAIADVVFVQVVHGRVVSAVTDSWQRFDLLFLKPSEFAGYSSGPLKQLFNRSGVQPPTYVPSAYAPSAERILALANEFLRVLGLAVVGAGRKEYIVMLDGIGLLRKMTVDLMLEQNRIGPAQRGGALHLNALLTDEQRQSLESLPALTATHDSAIAASRALAQIFLPLAKRLANDTGATWPVAFEDATRRSLQRRLGMTI